MSRAPREPIAVFGTGRLAGVLVPALRGARFRVVAVAGRSASAARRVAGRGATVATTSAQRAASQAGWLLLAVPDRALEPLAARLSVARGIDWGDRVVLHHAGALGVDPLLALRERGAAIGLLHPLQVFGDPRLTVARLAGSRARVEGDPRARRVARTIARALGLITLPPTVARDAASREAYHAAAAVASNDVVALLALAADLMVRSGLEREAALRALVPLTRGTLEQIAAGGLAAALSGPVARGDAATVELHLARLRSVAANDAEAHRLLSLRLLAETERAGMRLDVATRRRLVRALAGRAGRGRGPAV